MRGLSHLPRAAIENAKMMIDGDAEAKKVGRIIRRMLSHDAVARGLDYSSFRSQHGSKGTPLVECGC
jgi:hypothetical protein